MTDSMRVTERSATGYYRRKLFSFFGLVPMALFVVVHLTAQASSQLGQHVWQQRMNAWHENPFYWPVVVLIVYLPFAFHTIYGLVLTISGRPTGGGVSRFAYTKYLLQRLSALGLVLFLGAHLFKTRIEPALHGDRLDYRHMVEAFHHPPTILVYVLGLVGVAFHLANGLWLGAITWGVTVSRRSQRAWQTASIVLFLALLLMGFAAMWGFARAPLGFRPGQAQIVP